MRLSKSYLFSRLDKLLGKFGFIYVKEPAPSNFKFLRFNDKDLVGSAVSEVLRRNLGTKSIFNVEILADLTNQVIAEVQTSIALSPKEQVERHQHKMLAQRMLDFVLASGIASYWEFQVRNLAGHLKIDPYEEVNESGGKKYVKLREIEDILKNLVPMLPKVKVNFKRQQLLRNSLIHGNFHQLKVVALESQKREVRKKMQGSVWAFSFNDPQLDPIEMNSINSKKDASKYQPYAWFLEVATSETIQLVGEEFIQANEDINKLISLCTRSSGAEKDSMFMKLCRDGIFLTTQERTDFINKHSLGIEGTDKVIDQLLSEVEKLIDRKT